MKRRIFIILGILILLVPLGLLTDNPAWGEWDLSYYEKVLGFVPKGMEVSLTTPVIPDYEVPGFGSISGYYLSAIVGVVILFGIYYVLAKILRSKSA